MGQVESIRIWVQATINAPIKQVWEHWTTPQHIIKWNTASEDWHTIRAENDLREGGRFTYRMEAKDGSTGFDFSGVYEKIITFEQIDLTLDDGRKVQIGFSTKDRNTIVVESFEAETTHSIEMQRMGWQSILDNLKKTPKRINPDQV